MIVVYTSQTGNTKKYAELFAEKNGLAVFPLSGALKEPLKGHKAIYFGWLCAGGIKGLQKADRQFQLVAAVGVGLRLPDEKIEKELCDRHGKAGIPLFYLPGGFDMQKLHGINRFLMGMMRKTLEGAITKKEQPTGEEQAMLEALRNGADYVEEAQLEKLLNWYAGHRNA